MSGLTWQIVLIHALFYPVYQLLGTIRHELAHAVAAWAVGVRVTSVKVLPHRVDGRWLWGRTTYHPEDLSKLKPVVPMAPYYVDLYMISVWGVLYFTGVMDLIVSPRVWLFFSIVLLVSSVVNLLYVLWKFYTGRPNDLSEADRLKKLGR